MTRAEQFACKYAGLDHSPTRRDELEEREKCDIYGACLEAYEQAEKDLALTINDLELLHTFLYAVKNNKQGCFTFTRLSDEQYQEVLKRFKEAKK